MPQITPLKQGRDHPSKFTNWYIMKECLFFVNSLGALNCTVILKVELKKWILMNLFKRIESKQHRKTLIPVNTI